MNFKMALFGLATSLLAVTSFAATSDTVKLSFTDGNDTVTQLLAVPAPGMVELTLPSGAVCQVDVTVFEPASKPIAIYLDVEKTASAGGPFKFFSAGGMLPEKGFGMVQLLIGDYWCSVQQEK